MSVTISKADFKDYPYVEPNLMAAPRDGRVYAQLPADESITVLTNGQFVKYDYAAGKVDFAGKGPWVMVFNEEKLYRVDKQSRSDYAMTKEDSPHGVMVPRVFGISEGDIFTTNNLADGTYTVGDLVTPAADTGTLAVDASVTAPAAGTLVAQVVKETTMPDGRRPAVKLQVLSV